MLVELTEKDIEILIDALHCSQHESCSPRGKRYKHESALISELEAELERNRAKSRS